ncbi:Hypothetical protein A7982_04044 [Minicystis rosea]|nr:Hypothetical protein A7982_04044 [Minicystis rosea]
MAVLDGAGPLAAHDARSLLSAFCRFGRSALRVGTVMLDNVGGRVLEARGALLEAGDTLMGRGVSSTVFVSLDALAEPRAREVLALRDMLLAHPLYARLHTIEHLRVLMEHHVWAVWDFMSLLKSIQAEIAPVRVPWRPPRDPESARLINEIVVGEESDDAPGGGYTNHFAIYVEAMRRLGADDGPIRRFVARLDEGEGWEVALAASDAPASAKAFVTTTLRLATSSLSARVSAFTVGREEIIPDMFRDFVGRTRALAEAASPPADIELLRFYFERHIEVDGDRHGPMASRLFERVCLVDAAARAEAFDAGARMLAARIALWDAIAAEIARRGPASS